MWLPSSGFELWSLDPFSTVLTVTPRAPLYAAVFQWEPSACRSCQCCQKRDHQKFVSGFALTSLLGSGRSRVLPLGTVSWSLGHNSRSSFYSRSPNIKNCGICIDQLDHLPAVMTTSFFLIFSEHPWNKLRANLPHLQLLANNCVYCSYTDIKLCTYWRFLSMKFFFWPINSGVLTSLLLPHLLLSLTDSLPLLNLLCHSKTDVRFMQDGRKAVWSIQYVSVAFFSCLKQNFIAYRSSKVSSRPDFIFEID